MHSKPKESDWKHFRSLVPELRERYLSRTIENLVSILREKDQTPTERFWNTEEAIKHEAKTLRSCLDGHSRSRMMLYIFEMCSAGLMCEEDLEDFSQELQEHVKRFGEFGSQSTSKGKR